MSRNEKKIYIPLWRDRCEMLIDNRLSDSQVGAIIRAAIRYEIDGTRPEPMENVGLDVICSVLISDIDVSREARRKVSKARATAARSRNKGKSDSNHRPSEAEIDAIAYGYYEK